MPRSSELDRLAKMRRWPWKSGHLCEMGRQLERRGTCFGLGWEKRVCNSPVTAPCMIRPLRFPRSHISSSYALLLLLFLPFWAEQAGIES